MLATFLVLRSDRSNLSGTSPQQNGMAADVFALHISCSLKVLISIAEADEAKTFTFPASLVNALGALLVSNHSSFLDGWVFREGLEKGFVRHFACQIANEESKMSGIPLKKGRIRPGLTASTPDDGLLLAIFPADNRSNSRVWICGGCDCSA